MKFNKLITHTEQLTSLTGVEMKRDFAFHSVDDLLIKILFVIIICSTINFSQNRSKIEGKITDTVTGEELIGVNVILLETHLGAATDLNGKFIIINVPAGTYDLQASMIGYSKKIINGITVSTDRVTTVSIEMNAGYVEGEEVIVIAKKNELHNEVSNTQLVVTSEQITNSVGVRDINTFLEKQPGISSERGFIQIRGGSADQTGSFVDGMSYNNAAVGNSETTIPLSSIEQVSVLSGGFNAEYGNFRSGLLNVTTKAGDKNKYHGTISVQRNVEHLKRFGPKLSDPRSPALAPFLDPQVAFVGTASGWADDEYKRQQHDNFDGWIQQTEIFNQGRPLNEQATPLDYYLLAAWMHMAIPDYEGLAALGYEVSDEHKKLFEEHVRQEEGIDYNIDMGFGGPIPFISEALGDATFFLSHVTKENYYIFPFARRSQENYVTRATLKSNPNNALTIRLDGLVKRQIGLSPLKPAFGDSPDAGREGGFMTIDNTRDISRISSLDAGTNYWYDVPIFPLLEQTTFLGAANINYMMNEKTFWEFKINYSSIKDHSPTGDNRDNTALTHFGPFPVSEMPYGKLQFANNNRVIWISGLDTVSYLYPGYDALPGVSKRFRSKEGDLYTNVHSQQVGFKFDLVTQYDEHNYIKTGLEYNYIDLDHKMWLKWNRTGPYNSFEYNYHRFPSQTGFYIQDQVSYSGIIANIGTRLDYYYGGGGKWPTGDKFADAFTAAFGGAPPGAGEAADSFYAILASGRSIIWEKWEEYDRQNPGFLESVKNHFVISPRLGLSFPISTESKFYFNYGHFRSNPPYSSMFLFQYRYDKQGMYEMSNPNLEPPKTIQYELGVEYNVYENMILKLSGYYKDVTGQHGEVNYQRNSDGLLNYDQWDNNEYEDIQGLEITVTKNDASWLTGWINFNYMLKKEGMTGKSVIYEIPIIDERSSNYVNSQQRLLPKPIFNANISLRSPDNLFSNGWLNELTSDWRATIFLEWKAGDYFTHNPLKKDFISQNLQWPDYYMVDLSISKSFKLLGFSTTLFMDINNVFNFKVSLLNRGYAFRRNSVDTGDFLEWTDTRNYLSSLRLPMYDSPEFDNLRAQNPGYYLPGDDEIGELRSSDKLYINDPDFSYFLFGQPRDIWFGIRIDF